MSSLTNLLLEELPGASPGIHLAVRGCGCVSSGWGVRYVDPISKKLEWESAWDDRDAANQHINDAILTLHEIGSEVGEFHLVEIFLKW